MLFGIQTSYDRVLSSPLDLLPYALFFAILFALAQYGLSRWAAATLLAVTIVFVGLRFETGFDWPVYKRIYSALLETASFEQMRECHNKFGQEPAFLALLSFFAGFEIPYEYVQALISGFFVVSTYTVARCFNANPILSVAIAFTLLLPSIAFSTARQCLALSFFLLGLAAYLRDKHRAAVAGLLIASLSFQVSAAIYIIAFLAAIADRRIKLRTALALAAVLFVATAGGISILRLFSDHLPERLSYYVDSPYLGKISLWTVIMMTLPLTAAAHVYYSTRPPQQQDLLHRLVLILAILCFGSVMFPIANDRTLYGFWVLYAIFVSTDRIAFERRGPVLASIVGLLVTFSTIGRYPNELAFFPYQNLLLLQRSQASEQDGVPSEGARRSEEFMKNFEGSNLRTPRVRASNQPASC